MKELGKVRSVEGIEKQKLTVIGHLLFDILPPKHTVIIPFTIPILAVPIGIEIWEEVRYIFTENVEICKEKLCTASNRTVFNISVPNCTILIHATLLIVFGIVSERCKYLHGFYQWCGGDKANRTCTGILRPTRTSSIGISDMNRSDQRKMRAFSPRTAVVAEKSSMALSRRPIQVCFTPLKWDMHQSEVAFNSASVYVSTAGINKRHVQMKMRLTRGGTRSLEYLGACCSLGFIVLGCGLDALYAVIKPEADLCLHVILVEMVVVDTPVLERADLLRDDLFTDGGIRDGFVTSALALWPHQHG